MPPPERLADATRLLSDGAWQEAETVARAVVANDPADPLAALVMGLAIAAMGEDTRAAPILNQVAASHPDARHPCVELAQFTPPLPRTLIARQFRACLRHDAGDDRLRLAFAQFLLDNDQPADAAAVLALSPRTAAACHLLGSAQAEQNQFPEAIASFQAAVALDPDAAASWSNLGMMLKIQDRFHEAITAHDQAVALQPADPVPSRQPRGGIAQGRPLGTGVAGLRGASRPWRRAGHRQERLLPPWVPTTRCTA